MANMTIAVVDDDRLTLRLLELWLGEAGYAVIPWSASTTAYAMIRRQRPDLVLLDLHMEEREAGWRVLTQVRADPTTAHIPVILCTSDQAFLRARAGHLATLGCATLAKPYLSDALEAKIAAVLNLHLA